MISSEVQRTLVKSPPELWAELSDPDALARHLGELGEIRIVRTEPESTVEWAAANTTGTVTINPSGWGTRVTLSVTRETIEAAAIKDEAPVAPEPGPAAAPVSATLEPEATANEPSPAAAPGSEPATPEPTPRRGFFVRLFRRRQPATPEPAEPEPDEPKADAFAAIREALAPETFAAEHPFAALPPVDIAAELKAAEEAGTELAASEEEVTALLTAVLDRLGAAHHRPFSRS